MYAKENHLGFSVKTGLKFHATKKVHFGIDLQILYYQAPGVVIAEVTSNDKWRSNTDLVFSIGFSF